MASTNLHFYFDYLSPYAYLAWFNLKPLLKKFNLNLQAHPILLAGLLNHWEHKGPAEIPPKKKFTFKDCIRKADQAGASFFPPPFHPFNPLPALRLSLPQVGGEHQLPVIDILWRGIWGQGKDGGSLEVLSELMLQGGFPAMEMIQKISKPDVKEALRLGTEEAISRGIFGVPTFTLGEELFWGNDQIFHMEQFLLGCDPVKAKNIAEILARPAAVSRSRE